MYRHHLILFYRNLKRYKSTFFINLIGLSTGLACALFIFLWVADELQIDKFHAKDLQLYQVMEHVEQSGALITRQSTSGPTAETIANEFPEVEKAVTVTWIADYTLSVEESRIKAKGLFAGTDFFNMFSFDLTQGDKGQVLEDKSSIVVSQSLAAKLFGTAEQAIGKAVKWQQERQYIISGVFEDISAQSSLQFDFVIPFENFKEKNEWVYSWGSTAPQTYLLMKDTDMDVFNQKIASLIVDKSGGDITHRSPFATLFSDAYLYNTYENGKQAGGRIEYVRLFSIIAIFILLIACINFMNLSTARATRRLKEIGIKKAVGAQRSTLVTQYLSEATLMAFLALMVALMLVLLLLPQFNLMTGKALRININSDFLMLLLSVLVFTGLIAGSYPALYLSKFNPATVLKGGKLSVMMGEQWARKGLVVFQFSLSVILIVSVLIVYLQIDYVQKKHLGYDRDHIIMFPKEGQLADRFKLETFLLEVKNVQGVKSASSLGHNMVIHNSGTSDLVWEGKDPQDRTEFERVPVNYDMIELLDIPMHLGRAFSREYGADSLTLIINKAGMHYMGLEDPIGRTITFRGEKRQIVGISEDFHFESFHKEVKPLFFHLDHKQDWNIMIKLEAGKEKETLDRLQQLYTDYNPGFEFDYSFLDEDYRALYKAEQHVATLSKYFAGLAILISCLGLYGLASYTTERRTKEIGIRKTLGASEMGIVKLLSYEFLLLVFGAIVIALPLSYVFSQYWLGNFAYKIYLEWWYFIGSGLLTILVALATVSSQAIKAALMNPIRALRSE